MISGLKVRLGVALFGLKDVNVLRLCHFALNSVGNCNNFDLILLNLSRGLFLGYRWVVFSLDCGCFCVIFLGLLVI
jgi:hypothetical protein